MNERHQQEEALCQRRSVRKFHFARVIGFRLFRCLVHQTGKKRNLIILRDFSCRSQNVLPVLLKHMILVKDRLKALCVANLYDAFLIGFIYLVKQRGPCIGQRGYVQFFHHLLFGHGLLRPFCK